MPNERNKHLAELLGWTTEKHPQTDLYSLVYPDNWNKAIDPRWFSEHGVWVHAPDFERDANAREWAVDRVLMDERWSQFPSFYLSYHRVSERSWRAIIDTGVEEFRGDGDSCGEAEVACLIAALEWLKGD